MIIGKGKYPTEKEIMTPTVSYKDETLEELKAWKEKFFTNWLNKGNTERLEALECLVQKLCNIYGETIKIDKQGSFFAYDEKSNTMHFDATSPSIISTLHEFRHKINGPDEVSACRWSIQLFARCFPSSFEKLEFEKGTHLLMLKK